MREEWRPVCDYEGYYEVSNQGRVWSVRRQVDGKCGLRWVGGHYMKPALRSGVGVVEVHFRRHGEMKSLCLARVVLSAFEGIRQPGFCAGYRDGNWRNCHLDNLKWVLEAPVRKEAAQRGANAPWTLERREAASERMKKRHAALKAL